jgi:hypothetical protein
MERHRTFPPVGLLRVVGASMALALLGLSIPQNVSADVASDKPAAIVIFPKLLVDTSNGLDTQIRLTNTSNQPIKMKCFYINTTPVCSAPGGSCFPNKAGCVGMVDGLPIFKDCKAQWQETDFIVELTARQPTTWLVSQGAGGCNQIQGAGVCSNNAATKCVSNTQCGSGNFCVFPPCFPFDGVLRTGPNGQDNAESSVPPSPEDPFIGELKCIALDESLQPVNRNDLKGEALIGISNESERFVDIAGYNAIGIPGIEGQQNRDGVLVLGGAGDGANPSDPCHATNTCPEYEGCPNFLILNHYFDGAVDPMVPNICRDDLSCSISETPCTTDADCENVCKSNTCTITATGCVTDNDCDRLVTQARVATDLTLVPCTQDLLNQDPDLSKTTAQFLVFNEFEQRFSTSREVNCFQEWRLSELGIPISNGSNDRSIFSAGVAGSMTGQTRIRGVVVSTPDGRPAGNALLGIAEEFRCRGPAFPLCGFTDPEDLISSTATNLHFQGLRPQSDFLYLP